MHHRDRDGYLAFCSWVVKHDTVDYRAITAHCMNASGGMDPHLIVDWIDQWVLLRTAENIATGRPLPKVVT